MVGLVEYATRLTPLQALSVREVGEWVNWRVGEWV